MRERVGWRREGSLETPVTRILNGERDGQGGVLGEAGRWLGAESGMKRSRSAALGSTANETGGMKRSRT